jgi:hypothetical protein
VLAVRDRLGECIEKRLHCDPVGVGQDQRERVVGAGLDGGVDVGVDIALIEQARRSLAALPPDVADAPLSSPTTTKEPPSSGVTGPKSANSDGAGPSRSF